MDEREFGKRFAAFRKERGLTQDGIAEVLHVSAQAVSKWENGHSLPETALLPAIARVFDVSLDELFRPRNLLIERAEFGDGIDRFDVTGRLGRLVENDALDIEVVAPLLGISAPPERALYLTLRYQSAQGTCYAVCREGERLTISAQDIPEPLPHTGLRIVAGSYGTKVYNYDVMHRIRHIEPFGWKAIPANHESFPSDPANDAAEYLTLVYLNSGGMHMVTCMEGESLLYVQDNMYLSRQPAKDAHFLRQVPHLPPFGEGMECSWAAALTAALQAMGVSTTYEQVMGVSGACYRTAFSSPSWDYSSVDGLVAYDYSVPGYAAYGYTPVMVGHADKQERAQWRERIVRDLRNGMPVLGINLRVAAEWGVITGYSQDGKKLYCRSKYDHETIISPDFPGNPGVPDDYLDVDNWPFLLCFFDGKRQPPSDRENLLASLKTLVDCADQPRHQGYHVGFQAYERWAEDLLDEEYHAGCTPEQLARRFSVGQFCALALRDAREAACAYLGASIPLMDTLAFRELTALYGRIAAAAREMNDSLETTHMLDASEVKAHWTAQRRAAQAAQLRALLSLERQAASLAKSML